MDGIEFLKEIRSRGNNAFFIICTGRHLTRVAIDTLNSGGNYYLQKGITLMDDMQKVIELIQQNRIAEPGFYLPAPAPADNSSQSLIDNQFVPLCGFDRNGRYPVRQPFLYPGNRQE